MATLSSMAGIPFGLPVPASSEAHRLCMQNDCNFVMYKKSDDPMWHTNTHKSSCNMCRMHLRDDGNLVLEKDGEDIWTSATSKGMK
ncbi:hypothetical protein SKAU_G00056880 [Synaphobranchus kaupii]|uniref:Bulb-type lectin domain-containing protein n=1 Tax=Synaphobranchus kaupii TaxID=118154 RepID=A0A9Q1J9Z5_SYNKA|nr:hypothetical protein SKAU_G00056880 [Synaphobranchus kaupii]